MILFKQIEALKKHLAQISGSIGFVPTMGALHEGHLSLIEKSNSENDITVCSIFVNPLQFNNKEDLKKYPRTLPQDMTLLKEHNCDIVFAPNAEEIYKVDSDSVLDFNVGLLDTLFEGSLRPGHFKGVAIIVNKLFDIVKPKHAYFGLKDYQQCMLIDKLVTDLKLPVELHFCPTLRESDGLAMSSRNARLSELARQSAPRIYECLNYAKANYRTKNITSIEEWCKSHLLEDALYTLEYFNIVNAETLMPIENSKEKAVALCAAFLDGVRLIDNLVLN